ncbi:M48 family metallopeptidase [Flavobacteriaceae bacterium]|nr:M48 family metallopeptidase [Flavobacteriaceae bacterium]
MTQSTFPLNSATNINIRKSLRAKRIKISINRETLEVTLIVPKYQTIKEAKKIALTKKDWIEKSLKKLKYLNDNPPPQKQQQKLTQISFKEKLAKLTNAELHLLSLKLIHKCQLLAKEHNFRTGKITIRNQKTLWGSCSGKNNISLNINLSFLKQELIDYVILHELTHIKNKNHSKKFWQDLENICPNSKILDKELKGFRLR